MLDHAGSSHLPCLPRVGSIAAWALPRLPAPVALVVRRVVAPSLRAPDGLVLLAEPDGAEADGVSLTVAEAAAACRPLCVRAFWPMIAAEYGSLPIWPIDEVSFAGPGVVREVTEVGVGCGRGCDPEGQEPDSGPEARCGVNGVQRVLDGDVSAGTGVTGCADACVREVTAPAVTDGGPQATPPLQVGDRVRVVRHTLPDPDLGLLDVGTTGEVVEHDASEFGKPGWERACWRVFDATRIEWGWHPAEDLEVVPPA